MTDSRTLPDLVNKPGKTNWVEKAGGLPSFIKRIAKHLVAEQGYTESRAIATAVSQCKKVCATGRTFGGKTAVSPEARARYCTAAAQWESKKAKTKVKKGVRVAESERPPGGRWRLPAYDADSLASAAFDRLTIIQESGQTSPELKEAVLDELALYEAVTGERLAGFDSWAIH